MGSTHPGLPRMSSGSQGVRKRQRDGEAASASTRAYDQLHALTPSTVTKKEGATRCVHVTEGELPDVMPISDKLGAATADKLVLALLKHMRRGKEEAAAFCHRFREAHMASKPFALQEGTVFFDCPSILSRGTGDGDNHRLVTTIAHPARPDRGAPVEYCILLYADWLAGHVRLADAMAELGRLFLAILAPIAGANSCMLMTGSQTATCRKLEGCRGSTNAQVVLHRVA
eukprot:jgi/Ulvmu1/3601/UM017_0013.1